MRSLSGVMRCLAPLACSFFLLLLALTPTSAQPVLPVSWPQQGGSSSNLGLEFNATYTGTVLVQRYAQLLPDQQCQGSMVYLSAANSFFLTCWNYDQSGNNNVTLWQIDAETGSPRYTHSFTPYAQSIAGPQLATPALFVPDEASVESSILFAQTNIELLAFRFGANGVISGPPVSVSMNGSTVLCGASLSISQTAGLVFLLSNAEVYAFDAKSFSLAHESAGGAVGRIAWVYSYANPQIEYVLSAVSEDPVTGTLVFSYARSLWGVELVALDRSTGAQKWSTALPFPDEGAPIASAPLVRAGRAFVSVYPVGLCVFDLQTGKLLTNGSYDLTQATGIAPSLFVDPATGDERVLYECATDDGISSSYQLCVTDIQGNFLPEPWPNNQAAMLMCMNHTKLESYGQQNSATVTGNGKVVTMSTGEYDMVSCVNVFDLKTGQLVVRYEAPPVTRSLLFASSFIDADETIYVLSAANDFTSTLQALHWNCAKGDEGCGEGKLSTDNEPQMVAEQ